MTWLGHDGMTLSFPDYPLRHRSWDACPIGDVVDAEPCDVRSPIEVLRLTLDALFESGDAYEQQRSIDHVRVVVEFGPDQCVELVVHEGN